MIIRLKERCARGDTINIITLEPYLSRKIPVYSKGMKHRKEMINDYYKYCNIIEQTITEELL